MTRHQANKPIRDCLTRKKSMGTRNFAITTVITTAEKRNSTVSCTARTQLTTPTTVEPLSSELRSSKRATVATVTTSVTTRK